MIHEEDEKFGHPPHTEVTSMDDDSEERSVPRMSTKKDTE